MGQQSECRRTPSSFHTPSQDRRAAVIAAQGRCGNHEGRSRRDGEVRDKELHSRARGDTAAYRWRWTSGSALVISQDMFASQHLTGVHGALDRCNSSAADAGADCSRARVLFSKVISTIDAMVTLFKAIQLSASVFLTARRSCGTLVEARVTARVVVPTAAHPGGSASFHEFSSTCQRNER